MVHFANKVITLHCTVNGGKKLPLGITTGDWTFLKTFKTQQANSDEKRKEGRCRVKTILYLNFDFIYVLLGSYYKTSTYKCYRPGFF